MAEKVVELHELQRISAQFFSHMSATGCSRNIDKRWFAQLVPYLEHVIALTLLRYVKYDPSVIKGPEDLMRSIRAALKMLSRGAQLQSSTQ